MNAVDQTTSATEVDVDAFAFNLVLGQLFQDMLKKPGLDDDPDQVQSTGLANEIGKTIAANMAQSITGFGL